MALHTRYLRPRGRKATCPYTELGTSVFIRGTPTMRCTREEEAKEEEEEEEKEEEEVFVAASSVVTKSDVRRSAARGVENHRHERRNLRSHHPCMQMPRPWGMPPYLSLSSCLSFSRPNREDFSSSHTDLPRSFDALALLLACPGYFTADSGLKRIKRSRP